MNERIWRVVVFVVVLLIEAVLITLLVLAPADQRGPLLTAVIVIAAALVLVPRIFDLSRLKVLGLSADLNEVRRKVDETSSSVRATDAAVEAVNQKLDTLFVLSISDWQYHNLEKIASGTFGSYVRSIGLENDLRHLRNHGYVEVPSVRDIPDSGDELCEYVAATEAGKAFVRLRQSLKIPAPTLLKQTKLLPTNRDYRSHELLIPDSDVDPARGP